MIELIINSNLQKYRFLKQTIIHDLNKSPNPHYIYKFGFNGECNKDILDYQFNHQTQMSQCLQNHKSSQITC